MSIWSDEPPTEPGEYWIQWIEQGGDAEERTVYIERLTHNQNDPNYAVLGFDGWILSYWRDLGVKFGPRVPDTAAQLAEMASKAAQYDHMMTPTSPATIEGFGENGFEVTGWGVAPLIPTQ